MTMSSCLEVHVLGGTEGESIVLKLPNGRWGVVDHYAGSLKHPEKGQTRRFLSERGVKSLEFVALTHPHRDHFRGMRDLIEWMPPRYFWLFGGNTAQDLSLYANSSRLLKAKAKLNLRNALPTQEDADDYLNLLKTVLRLRSEGKTRLFYMTPNTDLYPVPYDSQDSLRIRSIAPSWENILNYESQLGKCFEPDAQGGKRLKKELPKLNHNTISAALSLTYGDIRVILGGDVECFGWENVIKANAVSELTADLVKVSHHGSTNGYCDRLWKVFTQSDRSTAAVITPYIRFGLPREEGVRHILEHADVLAVTHNSVAVAALSAGSPFKDVYGPEVNFQMSTVFRNAVPLNSGKRGRCSFVYSDKQLLEQETESPAQIV